VDERDAEIAALRAQVEALTKERDDLSAIVFGRINGRTANPLPNVGGGQTSAQQRCTFCNEPCKPSENTRVFGLRYCDDCVHAIPNADLMEHAKQIMKQGGTGALHGAGTGDMMPANNIGTPPHHTNFMPDSTDTQVVSKSEWDAWLDAIGQGQTP
jgi:hypothetical protein